MTINVEKEVSTPFDIDYEKIIITVIEQALEFEECPYEVELNVILTDNDEIKQINMDYRDINEPTDVLSFPLVDYDIPADFSGLEDSSDSYFNPETGELMLGDIIISIDKVIEQAEKYGHSLERELAFLTAHSMLHLFGYDHMESEEDDLMQTKQEAILDMLGYTR